MIVLFNFGRFISYIRDFCILLFCFFIIFAFLQFCFNPHGLENFEKDQKALEERQDKYIVDCKKHINPTEIVACIQLVDEFVK